MIYPIELQVICRLLTTEDPKEIETLISFDESYYITFREHIHYILQHYEKYKTIPDVFTFQARFEDVSIVTVKEPLEYLINGIKENKQRILLVDTLNKLNDMGSDDIGIAWEYLTSQCEKSSMLSASEPMNIIKDAQKRADQIVEFSKQARIPTGFDEIDKLMYGGFSTVEELVLMIARTNTGKAQPLWSKVLTPTGWTTMGDLKIGDTVVGENNDNGHVVKIFPQGIKDYYRINFDDNTYVECCDDHLWKVLDKERRKRSRSTYGQHLVLTTNEIRHNIDKKYSVDISNAIEYDVPFDETNELDGYLLGVIIGDGCLHKNQVLVTNENPEVWNRVEIALQKHNCIRSGKGGTTLRGVNYGDNFITKKLIEYGLMNKKSIDKFIPKQYLTAPIHVRMGLLSGLLDTDGFIGKSARQVWEFDTASEQLASDFAELARSLGVVVKIYPRENSYYVKNGVRYEANGTRHLSCRSEFNPFLLSYKSERFSCRTTPYKQSMPKRLCKKIKSIEYVGKTECQCILLDNMSHTYITDGFTITHNSWVCSKMAEAAQAAGFNTLIYSPEMQAAYLGTRFDTWRGHFKNNQLYQGKYDEDYLHYIHKLSSETADIYILEDKDVSSGEVSAHTLDTLVARLGIKLLIVDGLSYMVDTKKSDTDHIKYKNICNDLFRLSKKRGCAVVITMQANRATKSDAIDDKGEPMPTLYNVEGSDHPGRICTQAFSLRQIFDKHVLDIRLEKSRNANNQKPVLSYAWDVNVGACRYIPGGEDVGEINTPTITTQSNAPSVTDDINLEDDDVEF